MGFCTEHLLYIRYMRGIRLLPFHFGCLGFPAHPGGDLARRMGVSGGWIVDVWMLINRRKMRRISRRIKSFLFGKCKSRCRRFTRPTCAWLCVFFFLGGGLGIKDSWLFFILKIAWGVFGHDEKNQQGMGFRQEIPRNPQPIPGLRAKVINTSKDELLQRIKMRFEKSKDLVVRACLGVVDVSWPSFFFLVNLLGG